MSFDTLSLSSSLVISTSLFRLRCHTYRRKLEPVLQRFQLQERHLPAWRIHAEFGKVRLSCSFPLSRCTCDNQVSLLWKLWNPSIASSSWKLLCIPWCTILDIVKLKRFKNYLRIFIYEIPDLGRIPNFESSASLAFCCSSCCFFLRSSQNFAIEDAWIERISSLVKFSLPESSKALPKWPPNPSPH